MAILPPVDITPEIEDRFWKHVQKVNDLDACWEWDGYTFNGKYGNFLLKTNGKWRRYGAHRVAYRIQLGTWPEHYVCHTCDNPRCVRGSHLYDGTQQENISDMIRKGRGSFGKPFGVSLLKSEDRPNVKLQPADIISIRNQYANGNISMQSLADSYQVSIALIHGVIRRTRWRGVD